MCRDQGDRGDRERGKAKFQLPVDEWMLVFITLNLTVSAIVLSEKTMMKLGVPKAKTCVSLKCTQTFHTIKGDYSDLNCCLSSLRGDTLE